MKRITITHATGLHARPAGQIAKAAQGFLSEVELIKGTGPTTARASWRFSAWGRFRATSSKSGVPERTPRRRRRPWNPFWPRSTPVRRHM